MMISLLTLTVFGCNVQTDKSNPIPSDTSLSEDSGDDSLDLPEDTGVTPLDSVVPLYDENTILDPDIRFDRGDAIVTRFADRGRDRHAREDQFQSYDHYLPLYWDYRTARFQFVDSVSKGGTTIEISMVTEWRLSVAEFRAWYSGRGTVASYSGNYANQFVETGPGTFDIDHAQISNEGVQYRYTFTLDHAITLDGAVVPLEVGQFMEFEASQFLLGVPAGRANYYGTTFLYEVGTGGMRPWRTEGTLEDQSSQRENSVPIDEVGWLGGQTTIPYDHSGEPDNAFMQMATNLSSENGQPFVRGRRIHHTNMVDGRHDESPDNGTFSELVGLAGPNFMTGSCDGCHHRNGRAPVAGLGEPLHAWVVKVGDTNGEPLPSVGRILQSNNTSGLGEGDLMLSEWVETDGLRQPVFSFSIEEPPQFSARIAPQLVGSGLLEAIPESVILEWEDPDDQDGDGISGRAHRVRDPETGDLRLGRLGWKASTASVRHQTADALNGDMGVMTTVLPTPDCGSAQTDCGNDQGPELDDDRLDDLVRYVSLLGIRARRDLDDPTVLLGEELFEDMGCASCHRPTVDTGSFHPYAELRDQTIHPYSDLLLHDMGPGLADSLADGEALGSEWRTAPLWGIGLGPCVTGGVEGPNQSQSCTPSESYLHDGRARTLDEAIRWHGGEGDSSRAAYQAASADEKAALILFLKSL